MPISTVQRHLGKRWPIILHRAKAYRSSIPTEGITGAAYADAVLFPDVDPTLIGEVLTLLNRRKLACVSRSRGSVRVFDVRPKKNAIPRDAVVEASVTLCRELVGHMMALARSEVAGRQAFKDGDREGSWRLADEGQVHCSNIISIIRSRVVKGLALANIREAMHDVFSSAAMEALTRYEARLAPGASADALDDPQPLPKPNRLVRGLTPSLRVLALIEGSGADGMTRTDLAAAIRPKPSADALSAFLATLRADRLIEEREGRSGGRGRPAQRYYAIGCGQDHTGAKSPA